jgi:DNA recombination protein RmuC
MSLELILLTIITSLITLYGIIFLFRKPKRTIDIDALAQQFNALKSQLHELDKSLLTTVHQNHHTLHQSIQQQVNTQMQEVREQLSHSFQNHATQLSTHVQHLTQAVNQQLNSGFDKTTETFGNVIKRLTIIDQAQQKISELSSHVVDLHHLFQDKRARGAFGEVQLHQLIQDTLPKQHYALQYTLSNNKRADCILFLPDPTGAMVIDAKFPLESYQKMLAATGSPQLKPVMTQFKQDIKKHIQDIASKYILANETADGAIMFIPSEAIFSEIHSHHPDLVSLSHQLHVWLASPSTLMAILTTASAVIKDDATKKQVHVVQAHLNLLAKDFKRFEKRMSNLNSHLLQANQDVADLQISAKKITNNFSKIERLDLSEAEKETADSL